MSRSREKSTFVTDNYGHTLRRRFMKKYSNRVLRRTLGNSDELLQGSIYKRHFDSWDICDFRWYWSEEMATKEYNEFVRRFDWFKKRYPTLESYIKHYRKSVVYK